MSYHLGVDLGTTYTAAAIAHDGRAEAVTLGSHNVAVPSVAYLATDGRVVIGEAAARRAVTDPRRVAREFKRRIGDPTPLVLGGTPIAAEMLAARSLAWVVTQVATTEGTPPASLAVTHPANWGPYKLDLLAQSIRHVGLRVDHFVPEPVAAATTYASQRPLAHGSVVAVYDLGGGTFDAALVRAGTGPGGGFELLGKPDGIEHLGGIDFDQAVFRHALAAVGVDPDHLDADDAALSLLARPAAPRLRRGQGGPVDRHRRGHPGDAARHAQRGAAHPLGVRGHDPPRAAGDDRGHAPGGRVGRRRARRRVGRAPRGRVVADPAGGPDGGRRAGPAHRRRRPPEGHGPRRRRPHGHAGGAGGGRPGGGRQPPPPAGPGHDPGGRRAGGGRVPGAPGPAGAAPRA